jgi:hypothetical protein
VAHRGGPVGEHRAFPVDAIDPPGLGHAVLQPALPVGRAAAVKAGNDEGGAWLWSRITATGGVACPGV